MEALSRMLRVGLGGGPEAVRSPNCIAAAVADTWILVAPIPKPLGQFATWVDVKTVVAKYMDHDLCLVVGNRNALRRRCARLAR